MQSKKQSTVYVAMSGGVDSSVAAALLKQQGFRVVGVFMKPWQEPGVTCLWEQDRQDALRVAAVLDIPLLTWDFSKAYGQSVAHYMIDAYRRGVTPNPDVMCNKEIKFGLFLRKALKEGADYIATGHYARVQHARATSSKQQAPSKLLRAVDRNKDQTYFLWTLTQAQLAKTFFPIGDYTKPQVRTLARKLKLPVASKKDSQGVCFIGPLDMKSFLMRHVPARKGEVVHVDGRKLGEHDGAPYYTIGQRHGLHLGIAGGPYYVVAKDVGRNVIIVGKERDLLGRTAMLTDLHFIHRTFRPSAISAKIRYRTPDAPARFRGKSIIFTKPQRAITPGQSVVFYHNDEVLGGGIIV
ncbi:MAG: tRNA 2-thiouridine(34) synthase MnmA [Patescibacteria group bacterium]